MITGRGRQLSHLLQHIGWSEFFRQINRLISAGGLISESRIVLTTIAGILESDFPVI